MLTPFYYPHTGGVEKHVQCVCRCLKALGHEVIVLTQKHEPALPNLEILEGVPVHRIEGELGAPISWRRRLLLCATYWHLLGWADVVHCHDFGVFTGWYLPFRFLMPRKPVYVTFHGYEGYPIAQRYVVIRRWVERLTRGNLCVGDFIVKWYGTRATFITYGGVDVEHYSRAGPPCRELPLRIAYFGRFEADTGVQELVEGVVAYQRASGRQVTLHLFGQGSLEQALQAHAKAEGVPDRISPPVPDTAPWLAHYPVVFASGYLTILEGLCAQRIVFAYYANPLREDYLRLHPAASSLAICGSARDVAQGLQRCHEDFDAICRASTPGWQWARQQTWQQVTQLYLRLWGLEK